MKSIEWDGKSAFDPAFLNIVSDWINQDGEVHAMFWFFKAGGTKAHYLFNSYDQFVAALTSTSLAGAKSEVDVYRHPQFPVRGWVDERFINQTLRQIEDQQAWFLMSFESEAVGKAINAYGDNNHKALAETLNDYIGTYVIMGPDIHWPIPPNDYEGEWISARLNA